MKKTFLIMIKLFKKIRTCIYCGYSGGGWKDDGECPSCGEVN